MPLTRAYAKVCDLRDFADPDLAAVMRDVVPEAVPGREHRKWWEFAMGAAFLRDVGRLDGTAEILDVAAGQDHIAFWLTRRARRVVAIDIYGEGDFGEREAVATMLTDPASLAPYPYEQDRLEVRSMDARALEFGDASFDAVISFSSIEHFGSPADIERAAREIGRVLRPGGHAFIVTEVYLDRHLTETAPVQAAARILTGGRRAPRATLRRRTGEVFTRRELLQRVVRPSGLELMQELDFTISPESLANPIEIVDGESRAPGGEFPHVVLRVNRSHFTSVALPLVKPG
jgi:SAM-dependent methyltransferase